MAGWAKREENGFCLNVIHCIEQPRQSGPKGLVGVRWGRRELVAGQRVGVGNSYVVGKMKRDTMGETML